MTSEPTLRRPIWLAKQGAKRLIYGGLTRLMGNESGEISVPVLSGPTRGLRFQLRLDTVSEPAYFLGTYERQAFARLADLVQPGWVVWDCGTYLGFYTVFFARLVGPAGRVVAFEPDSRNLARTRRHVAMNGFANVDYVSAAIGAPNGTVDFIVSKDTNSHLPGSYIGNDISDYRRRERKDDVVSVRCISLDEALREGQPPPDLIKLDIEGAEKDALKFMSNLAHDVRPLVVVELHNPECDQVLWEFATDEGYALLSMDTDRPVRSRQEVTGRVLCIPTPLVSSSEPVSR